MTVRRLIALCYGTRPQTIKASVLRASLNCIADVVAVDTGQHYDFELNELLYRELQVRRPDHYLDVGSGVHAVQTAEILVRMETLLSQLQPSGVLVIGDTNSTLGAALSAVKLRIPVLHVEAGLRAVDQLMPEEINRRVTDAVASVLCTPCTAATERLKRERPDGMVIQTGDVARDVLMAHGGRVPDGSIETPRSPYFYATLHRAELTDHPDLLERLLAALSQLPVPVWLALHPRTRAVLERSGVDLVDQGSLRLMAPVGYLESIAFVRGAAGVITDSGGLQREAYWLGVPCVTVRAETEWVETIAAGANRLVPPELAVRDLPAIVADLLLRPRPAWDRDAFGDGHAADRIRDVVTEWLS